MQRGVIVCSASISYAYHFAHSAHQHKHWLKRMYPASDPQVSCLKRPPFCDPHKHWRSRARINTGENAH
jgi:hypothetical protein